MAEGRASIEQRLAEIQSQLGLLRQQVEEMQRKVEGIFLPVEEMLRRRGLALRRWNPSDDLILPGEISPVKERQFYETMKRYSFRIFLREIIARWSDHSSASSRAPRPRHFCSPETEEEYLGLLLRWGILVERDGDLHFARETVRSFGGTLEWFVAQVMEREFSAPSIWGVRFDHLKASGDYDVLASLERHLLYMEIKSSPPKHIESNEIGAFLDRAEALGPHCAALLVDTELRMKDKLVPMLEEELRAREAIPKKGVRRLFDEIFVVHDHLFLLNSKPNLVSNLARLTRWWLGQRGNRALEVEDDQETSGGRCIL